MRTYPQPRRSATHNNKKTERLIQFKGPCTRKQGASESESAYDLLRGAAAAVAALALDPGDDGVRLRAALRAGPQDVLHRLPDRIALDSSTWGHSTAQRSSASDTYLSETGLQEAAGGGDDARTARNLSVCDGTTRSSWSAVSSMVAGYWPPKPRQLASPAAARLFSHGRRTLWRGEYLHDQCVIAADSVCEKKTVAVVSSHSAILDKPLELFLVLRTPEVACPCTTCTCRCRGRPDS